MTVRKPAVAGQFYPAAKDEIKQQIRGFIDKETRKQDCLACMLPHAGYIYSGRVAVSTISSLKPKNKIVLLGPNHTGYGDEFSIMQAGSWQTPLGAVETDNLLAAKIMEKAAFLKDNELAHRYEHSLEVELPILQYFKADFQIVAIAILSDNIVKLKELGQAVAAAIKELGIKEQTLIVASSDMTHYEPEAEAIKKDKLAIEEILRLDEDGLMKKINKFKITMCGFAPAIAMISAAKALGAKTAELIKYQTSADTTGDKSSVVGYAGIIIY